MTHDRNQNQAGHVSPTDVRSNPKSTTQPFEANKKLGSIPSFQFTPAGWDFILAQIGTIQLELGALSYHTRDPKYAVFGRAVMAGIGRQQKNQRGRAWANDATWSAATIEKSRSIQIVGQTPRSHHTRSIPHSETATTQRRQHNPFIHPVLVTGLVPLTASRETGAFSDPTVNWGPWKWTVLQHTLSVHADSNDETKPTSRHGNLNKENHQNKGDDNNGLDTETIKSQGVDPRSVDAVSSTLGFFDDLLASSTPQHASLKDLWEVADTPSLSASAAGDSYYEYLLKEFLHTGGQDIPRLAEFLAAVRSILDGLLVWDRLPTPTTGPYREDKDVAFVTSLLWHPHLGVWVQTGRMHHLSCFLGGLFHLAAETLPFAPPRPFTVNTSDTVDNGLSSRRNGGGSAVVEPVTNLPFFQREVYRQQRRTESEKFQDYRDFQRRKNTRTSGPPTETTGLLEPDDLVTVSLSLLQRSKDPGMAAALRTLPFAAGLTSREELLEAAEGVGHACAFMQRVNSQPTTKPDGRQSPHSPTTNPNLDDGVNRRQKRGQTTNDIFIAPEEILIPTFASRHREHSAPSTGEDIDELLTKEMSTGPSLSALLPPERVNRRHLLRPEALETFFFLSHPFYDVHQMTGHSHDSHLTHTSPWKSRAPWVSVSSKIFASLRAVASALCGFSGLRDVAATTHRGSEMSARMILKEGEHTAVADRNLDDAMPSYFFAETLKYLLFTSCLNSSGNISASKNSREASQKPEALRMSPDAEMRRCREVAQHVLPSNQFHESSSRSAVRLPRYVLTTEAHPLRVKEDFFNIVPPW